VLMNGEYGFEEGAIVPEFPIWGNKNCPMQANWKNSISGK
jgi:hypothetical protein